LYTGKGGVGKTSVAAATALRCADMGYRTIVLSTDSAHSLADSLDTELGPDPVSVTERLWGLEIDVLAQAERQLGSLRRYFASVFSWRGLERIVAEEMTVFPGLEELTSLLQVVQLRDCENYDVIVVDCAPTGATLQLLTMPEVGRWYLERILPFERRIFALSRPLVRALSDRPLPEKEIVDTVKTVIARLERMQSMLTDRELTTARLVLNPEKMVIKETRRAYMYLSLYGYTTDLLVCNRMLPPQASSAYMQRWRDIQSNYRQTIQESFAPLPILDVPLFDDEVVGLEMLRRMGIALYAQRDPTECFYTGPAQCVTEHEHGYALQIPLPMAGGKVQLTRVAPDELVVHIGNRKHMLSLPHTLAAMEINRAQYMDQSLHISFQRAVQAKTA
jgi:arsenite-transporting ATPase